MEGFAPPIHPRLAHLSAAQLGELIRSYYGRETSVRALMDEFNISDKPSNFVSILPPVVHDDLTCLHCPGRKLVSARQSRDSSQRTEPFCSKCGHRNSPKCGCQTCASIALAKTREMEERKRAIISARLVVHRAPDLGIEDLALCDAVFLLAFFRHSVSEDLETVAPFASRRAPLTPNSNLRDEAIATLRRENLIAPSPHSKIEAFIFNEDLTDVPQCYPARLDWLFLPGVRLDEKKEFIGELERVARDGPWPEHWRHEVFELWHEIAKAECFEYYAFQLAQRGYESEFGEKTHAVFDNLLETFSIGQVFNLTWQAVRDTTDYIVKKQLPKSHAKNTFIGSIQKKADRFRSENWTARASRRDFGCPQSLVSAVFFDLFMGVGGKALEAFPTLELAKGVVAQIDADIPF